MLLCPALLPPPLTTQEKKPAPFGWDVFNPQAVFNAADKRSSKITPDLESYT
jgi:hypothetical protein